MSSASAPNRFEKLQQLTATLGRSFLQDTTFFKVASAPLASLLLVNMRTIIAKQSAEKAKNSGSEEEAHFAEVEALKTVVREWGGVLSSFGLMALFNIAMDRPSQLAFGVDVKKHGVVGPVQYISQATQLLLGLPVEVKHPPVALGSQSSLIITKTPNVLQKAGQQFLKTCLVFKPQQVLQQAMAEQGVLSATQRHEALVKAGMSNWRNLAVPFMGMGIAMGAAGWVLERTTLLRFEKIIARIQHLRSLAQSPLHRHGQAKQATASFYNVEGEEVAPKTATPLQETFPSLESQPSIEKTTNTKTAYSRYYSFGIVPVSRLQL